MVATDLPESGAPLRRVLKSRPVAHAVIEDVGVVARPGYDVRGQSRFVRHRAALDQCLDDIGIPSWTITVQAWQWAIGTMFPVIRADEINVFSFIQGDAAQAADLKQKRKARYHQIAKDKFSRKITLRQADAGCIGLALRCQYTNPQ